MTGDSSAVCRRGVDLSHAVPTPGNIYNAPSSNRSDFDWQATTILGCLVTPLSALLHVATSSIVCQCSHMHACIPRIRYIGVCTTRLHEHDIPHILLLKKAEITAGQIVPIQYRESLPSLFYSNKKRILLWCRWSQPESSEMTEMTPAVLILILISIR
jgi:hypothetical protein